MSTEVTQDHWRVASTAYLCTAKRQSAWALEYDPTPGGRKNPDGSTSYSLIIPALVVTEYVSDPEEVAGKIAACLNAYDDMLAALKAVDALGMLNPTGAGTVEDAARAVKAAIAKAETAS